MNISFYVSVKGLCYICKKRFLSFYFKINISINEIYIFIPSSHKLYRILI